MLRSLQTLGFPLGCRSWCWWAAPVRSRSSPSACGFQLAFITVHLPPYLNDLGVSSTLAGWAVGLIGLANVIGAYGAGVLGNRHSKRAILSAIYFGRALIIAVFILTPVSTWSLLVFALVAEHCAWRGSGHCSLADRGKARTTVPSRGGRLGASEYGRA
jgi:MFS family permease